MIIFWLLFGLLAPLTISLIAFTYPAIQSIRSLEEKQNQEKWLTYWVVYGVFNIVEFFSDILLSWFPLYFFIKTAFLIWCMAPIKLNGSIIIFKMIILPFFILHKEKLGKWLAYSSTVTYTGQPSLGSISFSDFWHFGVFCSFKQKSAYMSFESFIGKIEE